MRIWIGCAFLPDGSFEGHFKDATDTKKFQWEVYPKANVDSPARYGSQNGWLEYLSA